MPQKAIALPEDVRLAVSPLSWANDVLEDLGADILLDTCLSDAAGYQGVELGRKFPRDAAVLPPFSQATVSPWRPAGIPENWPNAMSTKKWSRLPVMPGCCVRWIAG